MTTTASKREKWLVYGVLGLIASLGGYNTIDSRASSAHIQEQITANQITLSVINERVTSLIERSKRLESLRDILDATKTACAERSKALMAEIESLKRHVAKDSEWGKKIDERVEDIRERLQKLEDK